MNFNGKGQTATEVYFAHDNGVQSGVSKADRRYWGDNFRKAIGIGRFPLH